MPLLHFHSPKALQTPVQHPSAKTSTRRITNCLSHEQKENDHSHGQLPPSRHIYRSPPPHIERAINLSILTVSGEELPQFLKKARPKDTHTVLKFSIEHVMPDLEFLTSITKSCLYINIQSNIVLARAKIKTNQVIESMIP